MGQTRHVGFKKTEPPFSADLAVGLGHHALHGALMVFIGAVDVKKFETGHLALQMLPQQPEVKQLFGIAVHVQRPQAGHQARSVAEAQRAVSVCGGRTGIDEACAFVQGVTAQIAAAMEVVFHQKIRVPLNGGGTGPQMRHGADFPRQGVPTQEVVKTVAVQVIHILPLNQIAPFFGFGQIIHHHDFVQPQPVELPKQGAADKTRASGYDKHATPPLAC